MSRTCSQCAPRPSHEALRSLIAPLLPTTGDDYDKMIKGDPGVEVSGFAAAHSCSARRSCICLARRTTASKPCVTAAPTGGNHIRVGAHACLHARMPACMLAQHPVLPTHPANPPLNRPSAGHLQVDPGWPECAHARQERRGRWRSVSCCRRWPCRCRWVCRWPCATADAAPAAGAAMCLGRHRHRRRPPPAACPASHVQGRRPSVPTTLLAASSRGRSMCAAPSPEMCCRRVTRQQMQYQRPADFHSHTCGFSVASQADCHLSSRAQQC